LWSEPGATKQSRKARSFSPALRGTGAAGVEEGGLEVGGGLLGEEGVELLGMVLEDVDGEVEHVFMMVSC
jgi:hypothetical protein